MVSKIFKCPFCENKISITPTSEIEQIIICPKCNKTYRLVKYEQKKSEKLAESEIKKFDDYQKKENYESLKIFLKKIPTVNIYVYDLIIKTIGIILMIIGSYLLLNSNYQNLNTSIALIIIGISFFFLSTGIIKPRKNLIMSVILTEKITIIFAIWIIFSILIIDQSDFRLFLVIIIIGFLIIKEIASSYITEELNKRMKLFVIGFFLVYIMIVAESIAIFLSQ